MLQVLPLCLSSTPFTLLRTFEIPFLQYLDQRCGPAQHRWDCDYRITISKALAIHYHGHVVQLENVE